MFIVKELLSIEKHLNLTTERKKEICKFLKDKTMILDSKSFDGVDTFCGVASFVLKETCDYLGVLPLEAVKNTAGKEKVYLFNIEMIQYYERKLKEIQKKLTR